MQLPDENKPIGECTLMELFAIIGSRSPSCVIAAHVPDDSGTVDTIILTLGNRAACSGLAVAACRIAEAEMMGSITVVAEGEEEDDEEGEEEVKT